MNDFLNKALELWADGRYPDAISRMYYAVFHCIKWELSQLGTVVGLDERSSHETWIKLYHSKFRNTIAPLSQFQEERNRADYCRDGSMYLDKRDSFRERFDEMRRFVKNRKKCYVNQQTVLKLNTFGSK